MQIPPVLRSHHPLPEVARLGALSSLAAALILAAMCTIILITGTSQQAFETLARPAAYAEGLVAGATALRTIIFLDDLFVTAYVSATILFLHWLAAREPSPMHRVVLVLAVLAGSLDLVENHHILAMLRASELGLPPSTLEIEVQMVASSMKWILGHVAFAMIGLSLSASTPLLRGFRYALVGAQLPVGVLAWTQTNPQLATAIEWLRYGNIMIGFVVLAWLMRQGERHEPALFAVDSGAPA